jgi:hypothetical protein
VVLQNLQASQFFDVEEWILDGFILGRNWQLCQLKVYPQGNVDFPIDSRRRVTCLRFCQAEVWGGLIRFDGLSLRLDREIWPS